MAEKDEALEAARAIGRRYGENEADRQGLTGQAREDRIKRAEAYAVWRYNEKKGAGK